MSDAGPDIRAELTAEWFHVRDDSDVVYVVTNGSAYHSDPECHYLSDTERDVRPKPLSVVPHHRPCSGCCLDTPPNRPEPQHRPKDHVVERRRRFYDLIRERGPISRREIQFKTHESDKPTWKCLRWLLDRGLIREVDNPDDGRVPLYDAVDDRPFDDRAQASPFATGAMMVIVGLLLLFATAVAQGVVV